MERMTLHEAQATVAAVCSREGWGRHVVDPDWTDPLAMWTACQEHMRDGPAGSRRQIAYQEIAGALLPYHTHLAFEAGRAFSDAATLAYVDAEAARVSAATYRTDGGAVLTVLVSELRAGLHYAEPMPEGT